MATKSYHAIKRKLPSNDPSRYRLLSIRDKSTGEIIGYEPNPDYSPLFTCTRYPNRVYDGVYCEYKGEQGVGACEDCPYLVTTFESIDSVPVIVEENSVDLPDLDILDLVGEPGQDL